MSRPRGNSGQRSCRLSAASFRPSRGMRLSLGRSVRRSHAGSSQFGSLSSVTSRRPPSTDLDGMSATVEALNERGSRQELGGGVNAGLARTLVDSMPLSASLAQPSPVAGLHGRQSCRSSLSEHSSGRGRCAPRAPMACGVALVPSLRSASLLTAAYAAYLSRACHTCVGMTPPLAPPLAGVCHRDRAQALC